MKTEILEMNYTDGCDDGNYGDGTDDGCENQDWESGQ